MWQRFNRYLGSGYDDKWAWAIATMIFPGIPIVFAWPRWLYFLSAFGLLLLQPAISILLTHWRQQRNRTK
ncbi:hypothetical protein [Schleiferilactobacillus perolens]|uniref:Uncharacterized protein n=1 Tax=Schleiferilactobacillus perolens DSM 12744 TaxID=1423792 RepID=A0A0R1N0F1_9LACO|nr:hypothetical protein [Schleiferilactobacillus perolens]KRL13697.1 hypothetical protein FD09_GL001721 [Schleiferilactobacillus perolens DSM 12744]